MSQQAANIVEHPWMTRNMKVGDFAKVNLNGECPWAEVLEMTPEGFRGRINNKLLPEYSEFEQAQWTKEVFGSVEPLEHLHSYKQDDELLFIEGAGHWEGQWVPAECLEQTGAAT